MVKLQEMEFPEEEALVAAENCDDIYTATKFLRQECELCANVMNVTEVMSNWPYSLSLSHSLALSLSLFLSLIDGLFYTTLTFSAFILSFHTLRVFLATFMLFVEVCVLVLIISSVRSYRCQAATTSVARNVQANISPSSSRIELSPKHGNNL